MRPHVKALRKTYQSRLKMGKLVAASNCAKCGITAEQSGRSLELHHIVSLTSLEPEDTYDPNVQENLTTLCHRCHQAFHKCFEDTYGDDRLLEWIQDVPMDEVNSQLTQFQARRAKIRQQHINKHKFKNK